MTGTKTSQKSGADQPDRFFLCCFNLFASLNLKLHHPYEALTIALQLQTIFFSLSYVIKIGKQHLFSV